MTSYVDVAPRPPAPADTDGVRALVWGVLGVTPYLDRVTELLSAAGRGDPETRALVLERDGIAASIVLYGPIAGAAEAWQLRTVLVAPDVELREVGRSMIDKVVDEVRRCGGRLLLAELPADPVLGRSLSLLRANGFTQDGRIADFYRDGVALLFLRREL